MHMEHEKTPCPSPTCPICIRTKIEAKKLTLKERIQKQRENNYKASDQAWEHVKKRVANGDFSQNVPPIAKDSINITQESIVLNNTIPDITEKLLNPELDAISPVNLDPASMFADDMQSLMEEGKAFIKNPTLSGAAMMAVIAIPGKAAESAIKSITKNTTFLGKFKGNQVELHNIDVVNIDYVRRSRESLDKMRSQFDSSIRKNFLKSLGSDSDKIKILQDAGFDDSQIDKIAMGLVPKGYNVHHKIPLDDSGTNDFENLILIRNNFEHYTITNAQRELTSHIPYGENVNINFPVPPGFVYPEK